MESTRGKKTVPENGDIASSKTLLELEDSKIRITVKLDIILASSNVAGICKVLRSIFLDTMDLSADVMNVHVSELKSFIDDQILPSICKFIQLLAQAGFDEVQKEMITYLIQDWPKKYCLITIELIANIFAFIAQIGGPEILDEYVKVLSNSSLPPQFRYFILPSLLKHGHSYDGGCPTSEDNTFESDFQLMLKYDKAWSKIIENSNAEDDIKFITSLWSRLKQVNCDSIMDKLLPFCINTSCLLALAEPGLVDLIISVVRQRFLKQPISNPYSIIASCCILLGLQLVVFKKSSSSWTEVGKICTEIVKSCMPASGRVIIPRSVSYFGVKCVCSFIDRAAFVESEDMVQDLKNKIQTLLDSPHPTVTVQFEKQKISSKLKPEYFVPMFEKITRTIVLKNMDLTENDIQRLSQAASDLNNFILLKKALLQ